MFEFGIAVQLISMPFSSGNTDLVSHDVIFMFQMKNDFRKMEDEMDHLATNMGDITEFSACISDTLQDRRQQIAKLSGVHTLLKKVCSTM